MAKFSALGPSPVESIRLVEQFKRTRPGMTFTATSLPGHLIHLVLSGKVEQTSNGRRQLLVPGAIVWYHEDEWVEGRVLRAPWIYYSVNFAAPTLSPPNFENRLILGQQKLAPWFNQLWIAWRQVPSWERTCLCQSHLLALIAAIDTHSSQRPPTVAESKLWWEAESWARLHINRQVSLADLCAETGRSPNTIARACHAAVGMAPMKRLKQIRLSLARGLVHFSNLNMTEIALRVGYARVHEFSRDYRKAYRMPPTVERSKAPTHLYNLPLKTFTAPQTRISARSGGRLR